MCIRDRSGVTRIGAGVHAVEAFTGYMKDVRILKVTALYTSNFTAPTENLTAITNTSLLLQGTDAGIIDKSQVASRVSLNGGTKSSTGYTKYLSSSMYFDGVDDTITVPQIDIKAGEDFTIECWVRYTSLSGNQELIGNRGDSGGDSSNGWAIRKKATANSFILYWYEGGQFNYLNHTQGSQTAISADTWYHIAVTRSGNTWKLFLNGTAEDTVTDSGTIVSSNENRLFIGHFDSLYTSGYIDDLRITVGQARYTSNFTAPTTAHLTSAGDANKQIIVNSSADGVDVGTGGINQARIAKAWVNFDGSGTVSIRDSYNIASVTDNGTGDWTLNYSTAMSNTSYVVFGNGGNIAGVSGTVMTQTWTAELTTAFTTSASRVFSMYKSGDGSNSGWDAEYLYFITFGN